MRMSHTLIFVISDRTPLNVQSVQSAQLAMFPLECTVSNTFKKSKNSGTPHCTNAPTTECTV